MELARLEAEILAALRSPANAPALVAARTFSARARAGLCRRWERSWAGPASGNPHVDVELMVDLTAAKTSTTVRGFYDAARRDGSHLEVALRFGADGSVEPLDAPPRATMKRTLWQVRRETRADQGFTPHQVRPMLDAPFYSRSMVRTKVGGEESVGVHEALDLDRFANGT